MPTPVSSTVVKTFAILELFGRNSVVTTSHCAEALGYPKSTCYRLLTSLVNVGVLEHRERDHYSLSLALFELGSLAPLRRRLCDRARIPLERITHDTGFSTNMGALDGEHLVLLETIPGRLCSVPTRVGLRAPLHATSLGKLLLAHADEYIQESVLSRPLHAFTRRTISTPEALRRELDRIREQGYADEVEEIHVGTACLAVPVRMSGRVVAAISLSCPLGAFHSSHEQLRRLLERAALEIERGVAWQGSLNWRAEDHAIGC